jgi:hypothetical protein
MDEKLSFLRFRSFCVLAIVLFCLAGCADQSPPPVSFTPIALKAPAGGVANLNCRLRHGGTWLEVPEAELEQCRVVLDGIYNDTGLLLADSASLQEPYFDLEYYDPNSNRVIAKLRFYGTVRPDTGRYRVEFDEVGTIYVSPAVGKLLHEIGSAANIGRMGPPWSKSR